MCSARNDMSAAFPIGVATTYNVAAGYVCRNTSCMSGASADRDWSESVIWGYRMLGNLARMCALAGLIGGLCLPVSAMTTAAPAAQPLHSLDGVQLAQTDLTLQGGPDDLSYGPVTEAVEQPAVTPIRPPTRIALLLPTLSDSLKQVANAVRAGFTVAHQYEP